jgi:peptidoglycan/xylan/chitin deacetylase (PgdA/CDA1 family)
MLHDDWEIYGYGNGDPEVLMFDPAMRILDICDKYGAKYTFFAEIGQQLNMLETSGGKWQKYAATWESILKDAVARGHDVQLHFHPQWIGAELKNGEWKLDFSKWNAAKVDPEVFNEWIKNGVKYLRNLLQAVDPGYELLSFRAGGWMCQPSGNLYQALKNNGIKCDVTVMKGRYKKFVDGSVIDFRNAHSQFEPWEVDPDDFARKKDGSGFWELPVYSETSRLPHSAYLLSKSFSPKYYYNILKKRQSQKGGGKYSPIVIETNKEKDYYGSFGYMHYKHLLKYVNEVQKKLVQANRPGHLIYLTHSKSFLDFDNFDNFLCCLFRSDRIKFIRTRDYIKEAL